MRSSRWRNVGFSDRIEERRGDGIRSLYQFVVAHVVTAFASLPELVVQPTQVGIRSRRIGLQLARLQGRKRKNRAAAGPPDQLLAIAHSPPETERLRALHFRHAKRSEEHTSELQSLMRSSYAVFCLKKKNEKTRITELRELSQEQTHTDE